MLSLAHWRGRLGLSILGDFGREMAVFSLCDERSEAGRRPSASTTP
jgi:hypothetical protein